MRLFAALAFVVCLSVPFTAMADSPADPSLAEIRAQQLEYRGQAQGKTGLFKEMPEHQVSELLRKQNRFLTLTEGKASIEELPADDKVEAINHLEWIKATLTKADNERLVCERVKVVGSNRPQRVCRTVAEMRAERQEAERSLETRLMCGQGCRGN